MELEAITKKYGTTKEIIIFMHYPPFEKPENKNQNPYAEILGKYSNIKKVYYGHLHGVQAYGNIKDYKLYGIEYKLISADYLEFDIQKIY